MAGNDSNMLSEEDERRALEQADQRATAKALDKFREFLKAYEEMAVVPQHVDDWMEANMPKEESDDAQRLLGLDLPYQPGVPARWKTWRYCNARLPLTTSSALGVPLGTLSPVQLRQIPGLKLPKGDHGLGRWQHFRPAEETDSRILHLRRRVLLPYLQASTPPSYGAH